MKIDTIVSVVNIQVLLQIYNEVNEHRHLVLDLFCCFASFSKKNRQ